MTEGWVSSGDGRWVSSSDAARVSSFAAGGSVRVPDYNGERFQKKAQMELK
jgi:hypothetical protein